LLGFVKLTAVVYKSKVIVGGCELLMSKLHNNKLASVLSQVHCVFLSLLISQSEPHWLVSFSWRQRWSKTWGEKKQLHYSKS